MKDSQLKNIDPEDLEDLLFKVETSFNIKFVGDELIHVKTVGHLCDHIAGKIQLENSDDCTTQQAFYKLRDAIVSTIQNDKKTITTDLPLVSFLPRNNRRARTRMIESELGFKLNILRPPNWLTMILSFLLMVSFVGLFSNGVFGLVGLALSISGFWFSKRLANELDLKTIEQVVNKMTRENYLESKRNPKTFNKNEIEKVLTAWFADDFDIDRNKLTRDTELV